MKKLLCKLFGHRWKYFFTQPDSYQVQRTDIRVCKCCGTAQHFKRIISFEHKEEYVWMNMIGFTENGARVYHGKYFIA